MAMQLPRKKSGQEKEKDTRRRGEKSQLEMREDQSLPAKQSSTNEVKKKKKKTNH